MTTILDVQNLSVTFPGRHEEIRAVDGISFSMGNEKLGIVGESGSGKSVMARAILDLVRFPGRRTAAAINFKGCDISRISERAMDDVRGKGISMVMQDPRYSLNPTMTVGEQMLEAWRRHVGRDRKLGRQAVIDMLAAVEINDPVRVAAAYPHELSGGMGQRVMIAMMLIPYPDLLIADEPTSALDVTVQLEVLKLIDGMIDKHGMALLLISHDLPLVSHFCDRVLIMHRGRIVEECAAKDLHNAQHPYTRGLMSCLPSLEKRGAPLQSLARDPNR